MRIGVWLLRMPEIAKSSDSLLHHISAASQAAFVLGSDDLNIYEPNLVAIVLAIVELYRFRTSRLWPILKVSQYQRGILPCPVSRRETRGACRRVRRRWPWDASAYFRPHHGAGEPSAINAIGGAYAEMSPVVHIVGTPPLAAQNSRMCLHHSLGDGNFRIFADMYSKLTVAQANLTDASTAPSMIDQTLRQCILQSRPVYIEVPTNMVKAPPVSSRPLRTPINLSIPHNDEGFEDAEVELILARIYASKQPFIIVDGFTAAYNISAEADELVRLTGFPTSTTSFGKGIVNETYPNFHGIYAGEAGKQVYRPWVESCDLILRIGPLTSDVNTYGFTTVPNPKYTIDFNRTLDPSRLPRYDPYPDLGNPAQQLQALAPTEHTAVIDQDTFWQRISAFFRPGDIILTETGTPHTTDFTILPTYIQLPYNSFIGDGSLQMTVQSLSDTIRNRVPLTIFLINNDGYTIERFIHGMKAPYNDIQPWRYLLAPQYFGADMDDKTYPIVTRRAENWGGLWDMIGEDVVKESKGLTIIEVVMGREDAPDALKKLVQSAARRNSGVPKKDESSEEQALAGAGIIHDSPLHFQFFALNATGFIGKAVDRRVSNYVGGVISFS
ncbi:hypothetical protein Q3G72_020836 [Acer saccharum]|nr:hypothetical protein Q3G72_020836 [Acer saccharum]